MIRITAVSTTCVAAWILLASMGCVAQSIDLPNPSFEDGAGQPAAWTLSGGQGNWANEAQDGGALDFRDRNRRDREQQLLDDRTANLRSQQGL